jgi:hypothetical protein
MAGGFIDGLNKFFGTHLCNLIALVDSDALATPAL